jgi:hypothetical protein
MFFIQLNRWFPSVLKAIAIVRPETLLRWHRAGFGRYWRWKSRFLEPTKDRCGAARALIRRMSAENPKGELLGFEVAQSSVAKYMLRRGGPSSQGWRTFLLKHALGIAAMNRFVAPTIGFDQLYVLLIIGLERRKLVCINVTAHPTAEWIARQVRGIPWGSSPLLPNPRSVSVREV